MREHIFKPVEVVGDELAFGKVERAAHVFYHLRRKLVHSLFHTALDRGICKTLGICVVAVYRKIYIERDQIRIRLDSVIAQHHEPPRKPVFGVCVKRLVDDFFGARETSRTQLEFGALEPRFDRGRGRDGCRHAARNEIFQTRYALLLALAHLLGFDTLLFARGYAPLLEFRFFALVAGEHAFYIDNELFQMRERIVRCVEPLHRFERFLEHAVIGRIVDFIAVKRLVGQYRRLKLHFAVLGIYGLKTRNEQEHFAVFHAFHYVALVVLRAGENISRRDPTAQAAILEPRANRVGYILIGRARAMANKYVALAHRRAAHFLYEFFYARVERGIVILIRLRINARYETLDRIQILRFYGRNKRVYYLFALVGRNAVETRGVKKVDERRVVIAVSVGERHIVLRAKIVGKNRQYLLRKQFHSAVVARLRAFLLHVQLLGKILAPRANVLRVIELQFGKRRSMRNIERAAARVASAKLPRPVGDYGGTAAICTPYLFHDASLFTRCPTVYSTVRYSSDNTLSLYHSYY